jgi:hypothetical protein
MILECLKAATAFMAILFILMIGFALSQYFRSMLDHDMETSEFWIDLHDILFNAFGDFAHSEKD